LREYKTATLTVDDFVAYCSLLFGPYFVSRNLRS